MHVNIEGDKVANQSEERLIVINKIDFVAKNRHPMWTYSPCSKTQTPQELGSNSKNNDIFEIIDTDLVFDNEPANKIKMNHIETMLCDHFIGIDKLERLKLLQGDPLVSVFGVSVREPETGSRFLGNFCYKTTQMLREINFKILKMLLSKSKQTPITITIDIDSSVVNVDGHQEGTGIGYNPKKLGKCVLQHPVCFAKR